MHTKRIIKRYLWYPRLIDNQIHWFKTVYILQEYDKKYLWYYEGDFEDWFDIKLVDKNYKISDGKENRDDWEA